jgi:retron-type reverse transcriptase
LATLSSSESGRRPSHKISRDDILAHASAQCGSNKGAPGIDGQDFADIEACGVERWLAELALTLRQETYRPEPIRRVFIPKANGKLTPLGISSLRDRVCITAALHARSSPSIAARRSGSTTRLRRRIISQLHYWNLKIP